MKVAPDGGPRDASAATIVSVSPPSGSRNLKSPEFIITFDDYVDRGIRNDVTVIPKARFRTSYAGNEITLSFSDDLLPNTTYAITVGTNWRDVRGNQPLTATNIIFSTGPDIDSGVIQGAVHYTTMQNVVLLVYPQAQALDSTFSAMRTQAPYQIPIGSTGTFTVGGLTDGWYRLIAVQDLNRNGLADGTEPYGMAHSDVQVQQGASADVHIAMGPSPAEQSDSTVLSTGTKADSVAADTVQAMPGSVSGTFEAPTLTAGRYITRWLDERGRLCASMPVEPGKAWVLDSLPPGSYTVDVFVDADGDGRYSHGRHSPFAFAERWFATDLVVTVRQRWTTEDVRLVLQP